MFLIESSSDEKVLRKSPQYVAGVLLHDIVRYSWPHLKLETEFAKVSKKRPVANSFDHLETIL
jgi:hypothetical protein